MGGGFTMKTVYSLVVNAATQNLTTAIIADYAGRRWMDLPNERTAVCSWERERREADAGLLLDLQEPGIQKELRLSVPVFEAQGRTVLGEGI